MAEPDFSRALLRRAFVAAVLAAWVVPTNAGTAVPGIAGATMLLAQSEPGDDAGTGSGGGTSRREDPIEYPTPGDPHRWEGPASRLVPLKEDRREEADVDVEASREEAAALRREAAELRDSLERVDAQKKRGARVTVEGPDDGRRGGEIEERIEDLQNRARQLEEEADDLQGKSTDIVDPAKTDEDRIGKPERDPLSGDIDDDTDDDADDSDAD